MVSHLSILHMCLSGPSLLPSATLGQLPGWYIRSHAKYPGLRRVLTYVTLCCHLALIWLNEVATLNLIS